jgi:hypothetical protein
LGLFCTNSVSELSTDREFGVLWMQYPQIPSWDPAGFDQSVHRFRRRHVASFLITRRHMLENAMQCPVFPNLCDLLMPSLLDLVLHRPVSPHVRWSWAPKPRRLSRKAIVFVGFPYRSSRVEFSCAAQWN